MKIMLNLQANIYLFVLLVFCFGTCMNSRNNRHYTSSSGTVIGQRKRNNVNGLYEVMNSWYTIEPANKGKVFTVLRWRHFNIGDSLPYCRVVFVNVYVG